MMTPVWPSLSRPVWLDTESSLEVICLVASILPLVSLFQLMDGLAGVVSGILRALGQQGTGALLGLV